MVKGKSHKGRRTNKVSKKHMRRELTGAKLRVPNDPRSVNPFPYVQQTIVFIGKGVKLFTDKTLTDGVATQCQLTPNTGSVIQIKLQKVYVWQEIPLQTTTSIPFPLQAPLTVEFYSIFGEGSLSVQGDFGTDVRYSKVGYLWPISERTATLDSNPLDDSLFQIKPVDTDQGWLCHVHLLWAIHPLKPAPPTDSVADGKLLNAFHQLRLSQTIK